MYETMAYLDLWLIFPVNRYYVLDDTVALRDYNLINYEDHI